MSTLRERMEAILTLVEGARREHARDALDGIEQIARAALSSATERGDGAVKEYLTPAAADVLAERCRQIEREGYDEEHDDTHTRGELARAGAAYAEIAGLHAYRGGKAETPQATPPPEYWPFDVSEWKPKTVRRDLVRAAALILAEIEKLDRRANWLKEPGR